MRTLFAILVVVGVLGVSGAGAQDGQDPSATVEKANEPQLTRAQLRELAAVLKINAALDEETKIDVVETPLADVLNDIGKAHKIIVVLDPEGCEIAGVTSDQLVNVSLSKISLRNALRALLKPLHLSYVVRHEVLTITSLDCPDRLATVRTFPLGDLLKRMDDPSELITTLETMWPEDIERLGEEKTCQPRARILAGHLVVRGSPRHLEIAEQLIDGLMSQPQEKPAAEEPRIKAIIQPEKPLLPKPPPPKPKPPQDDEVR